MYRRCHVVQPMGLPYRTRHVLHLRDPGLLNYTRSVIPRQQALRRSVLGLVVGRFNEQVIVTLCLVTSCLCLLVCFHLQVGQIRSSIKGRIRNPYSILLRSNKMVRHTLLINMNVRITTRALRAIRGIPYLTTFNTLRNSILTRIDRTFLTQLLITNTNVCLVTTVRRLTIQ